MLSLRVCLLLLCLCAPTRADAPLADSPLTITTQAGAVHRFRVRLSRDAATQQKGLMFVRHLPPDEGMLFIFDRPHISRFWMKNTLIPLDIIFIAPGGQILNIVTRTDTRSERVSQSAGLAVAVLELNGGTAERLRLHVGARVRHQAVDF